MQEALDGAKSFIENEACYQFDENQYKQVIEQAQTIAEVEAIEIVYTDEISQNVE